MKFLILALTFVCSVSFAAIPSQPQNEPTKKQIKKPVAKKPIPKKPIAKREDPNPAYDINTVVSIDGIKSNPRFRVLNGQTASMEVSSGSNRQFTEVTINKLVLDGKPALQMEFVIGKVDSFGGKTIIATPKILANLGEKSSVMIGDKKLIISATATKAQR